MPPRKSDTSRVATGDEETPLKDQIPMPIREGISIEDFNLPKSIVTRLAKGVLPPNTQIQGNAMLAMTKSATVFVNYLATHANEQTQAASRKTISDKDVLDALDELEFPEFRTRLEAELTKFKEVQDEKKKNVNRNKASKAAEHTGGSDEIDDEGDGEGEGETQLDVEGQPAAKKARLDNGVRAGPSRSHVEHREVEDEEEEGQSADESEEDDDEGEERLEVEERDEEPEEKEADDEALDNGDDSD